MILKRKNEIFTIEELYSIYQVVQPTNKKVLRMITAHPGNNSEQAALDYLKRFVKGTDQSNLKSFLRYMMDADVICVPSIIAQFTTLDGLARRPITHTCGSVVKLLSTYNCFPELR